MSIEQFDGLEQRLEQMIDATVTGYEAFVTDHMPECLYRDFLLWGVSRQNPHRPAVMQLIGAIQQSKMVVSLLAGLTEGEANWQRLLRASMALSGWQVLEIVSDNLAMGLARHTTGDPGPDVTRLALLRAFNTLMAERLKGAISAASARGALSNFCSEGISLFRQSLSPLKLRSFAETFINERGGALSEIEYAAHAHLIANIEVCVDVVNAVEGGRLRSLVRDSLAARYEGINKLLDQGESSFEEVLDTSAYTVLVIPTLGYFVSGLIQCIGMQSRLDQLIDEGSLAAALYDAALLVRLQNDVGAKLLTFDAPTRSTFLRKLEESGREYERASLSELLVRIGRKHAPLNRIWKDACLGEFNVCLSGIGHDLPPQVALSVFGQRLALCAEAYSVYQAKLVSELLKINDSLEDTRVSQLIIRFVRFHERLYSHFHDTVDGDYATS